MRTFKNICFVVAFILSYAVSADIQQGEAWLGNQQKADGGVYSSGDRALPLQSSFETLIAKRAFGKPEAVTSEDIVDYLASSNLVGTEFLAIKLIAGIKDFEGQAIADMLRERQNRDGGFGDKTGYGSTPYDTYWALRALELSGNSNKTIRQRAIQYFIESQDEAGAWGYSGGDSVYLTGRIQRFLVGFRGQYTVIEPVVSASQQYLTQRAVSGEPIDSNIFQYCVALSSLTAANSTTDIGALVDSISARQGTDGSWAQDVFSTALCMKSLLAYEAAKNALGSAAITGRAVTSGSDRPIAGVTVSAMADSGLSTTTDSDGIFVLSQVSQKSVNLVFEKSGYASATKSVSVDSSENDIGAVPMALNDSVITLMGVVKDATTNAPVSGAAVTIQGLGHSTTTNETGSFYLSDLESGNYEVTVNHPAYHSGQTSISLEQGQNYNHQFLITPSDAVLDDSPADVAGRVIKGVDNTGLDGVAVEVDGNLVTESDSTGRFVIPDLARGEHTLRLDKTGFESRRFTFSFPPGATAGLGDLVIFPLSDESAPEDLSLTVTLLDAVDEQPIGNAVVSSSQVSADTNAEGQATLNGIESLEFTVTATADGYRSGSFELAASGYGELSTILRLTPEADPASSTTLEGTVSDQAGNPIAGATVTVDGNSVETDANGQYRIETIESLEFLVEASKSGFHSFSRQLSVQDHGRYVLDVALDAVTAGGWQIFSVNTPTESVGANTVADILATIQNTTTQSAEVVLRGQVFNGQGEWVRDITPYVPGTEEQAAVFTFAPEQIKTLTFPFSTVRLASGSYTVKVDVIELNTITRALPSGVVLASANGSFSIASEPHIGGSLNFDPPLTQAGSETPVELKVLLENVGNELLSGGTYQLTIASDEGITQLQRDINTGELPISNVREVNFGSWLPEDAGHFSVTVTRVGEPEKGQISGIYYVGDVASGEFTVNQEVLPKGDSQVGAQVNIRGVDTKRGGSADPLFEAVREAVVRGGEFVGDQSVSWHKRNRCLGCHIQTQSLVGLASSMDIPGGDKESARFLYNTLASAQRADGRVIISHPHWSNTQTQLAAWAMSEWPNKQDSYKARYRAVEFLWNQRDQATGDALRWVRDHRTGWLRACCEGSTAIVSRAIADLIRSTRFLEKEFKDYTVGKDLSLDPDGQYPQGIHKNGNDIYIAKTGEIERVNLSSDDREVIDPEGINQHLRDIWVTEAGAIYLISKSHVSRINQDGSTDSIQLTARGLRSLARWNDAFYISDSYQDRIWKVTDDLEATVFLSKTLLDRPMGLEVSSDNTLLVANYNHNNIIEINEDGDSSKFASGFSGPPQVIVKGFNEDEYLVVTGSSQVAAGIFLLHIDGTLEKLSNVPFNGVSSNYMYDLTIGNNKDILLTNRLGNVLSRISSEEFNKDLIPVLENRLDDIAKYFLNNYSDNTNETVRVAFRLMGLSEIASVTQDEALNAQIEEAIPVLEQLLRDRQNDDGGWGVYRNSRSDPLTTAWVGYALDYTNPSAKDPMVRDAITYLLNEQRGDGSWDGAYFSTRLGTTSMVMAYMPRALERLGGLDVDLELSFPSNVIMTNPSHEPTESTPLPSGGTAYRWQLQGVTNQGQDVAFDLNVQDLGIGEQRPVATDASLKFENSFTEEIIERSLEIPSITASSNLQLSTGTDKASYGANEDVAISSVVGNNGSSAIDGTLVATIQTDSGVTIATLPDQPGISLASGDELTVPHAWNTQLTRSGDYQVKATVVDASGETLIEAVSGFGIEPSDGQDTLPDENYVTNIGTDKQSYPPYADVQLESQVINRALNANQAPVLAVIQALDTSGTEIYRRQAVISEMAAGAVEQYADTVSLTDAVPGLYRAKISVWNADVSEQLATSESTFSILDSPETHLTGEVSVDASEVYRGQAISCTYHLENRSESSDVGLDAVYRMASVETQEDKEVERETLTLEAGQNTNSTIGYDTEGLAPGHYACLLQTDVDGEVTTLDFAPFEVSLPPVEVTLGFGDKGRILILMDGEETKGTRDLSALIDQKDYLINQLEAVGYSYTIVHTEAAFKRELYSGLYHAYALLAEKVNLHPELQKYIREAVNNGAGLLKAGAFNRRNNQLERALGIRSTGRQQQAEGVSIFSGILGEDSPETIIHPTTMLDFNRCEADILGVYINPTKGNGKNQGKGDSNNGRACEDDSNHDAAAVSYRYGSGKAIYFGFDALDEATAKGGSDNAYWQLMLQGFNYIQPDEFSHQESGVVPLTIQVASLDVPVQSQAVIELSDNLAAVDQVPSMTRPDEDSSIWVWEVPLPAQTTEEATFYVQMLDSNEAQVSVLTRVKIEDDYFDFDHRQIPLSPSPEPDYLAEAEPLLDDLMAAHGNQPYSKVSRALNQAQGYIADENLEKAISKLLFATDWLVGDEAPKAREVRLLLNQKLKQLAAQVFGEEGQ